MSRLEINLCLTAGAGAGKTTRLVETYAALLAGSGEQPPLRPEQIVAITFTEKAAAEMKSRIVQRLGNRAEQAAALAWAPISTIHSFCAQLLREYGVALGLDPDFAVLDEEQFRDLLSEAAREVLRAGLKQEDPRLARVLGHYYLGGRNGLEEVLAWLHHGLGTMGVTPEQAQEATARAHEGDLARAGQYLAQMDQAVKELGARFAADAKLRSSKSQYVAKAGQLLEGWSHFHQGLQSMPPDPDVLQRLGQLVGGSSWGKLNDLRQALAGGLELLGAVASVPAAAQLADDLLSLAADLAVGVERELARRAVLDFDSLLIKARDLLRDHPGVLAHLQQRWRALLVDEYQDVNPVQGELVARLAGLDQEPGQGPQPPWLMVVGDRKQSIYAFRGAAVGVFSQTMAAFEAGPGQVQALPKNYRSHPALVHFFNRLFARVFIPDQGREHAPDSWVRFRPGDRQEPWEQNAGAPDERVVEVLDCRGLGQDLPVDAWRLAEARALAAWLREAFAHARYTPGQVAILLRKLTAVGIYEQALREAGVEFYTVRGRGFYACAEIQDLALALLALLDPGQELALAALLRSPLVGLSDESLLALSHPQPPERVGLAAALRSDQPLPDWCGPEQQARLARARWLLKEAASRARRLRPAELITWLLEETDLLPVLLGTRAGAQKVANLRKLIEIARQPGGGLAGGVEAFAAGLARLAADPPLDPQAPLMGEEASVVRLMSIHQAKGLEFPLVVLADLAGGAAGNRGLPALGPGGVLAAAPLEPASGDRLRSPLHNRLSLRNKAVDQAEEARLFYVACTRAQQRLLVCLNGAKSQGPWSRWVQDLALTDQVMQVTDAAALGAEAARETRSQVQDWPDLLPPGPGPAAEAGRRVLDQCLHRPPARLGLVQESVSGLENFLTCPRLYLLTSRLGLDTAALPSQGEGSGLARAVELGSLVHALLERCDLAAGPEGLEQTLAVLEPAPELAERALMLARGLWDTELPALLTGLLPEHLHREMPFRLLLNSGADQPDLELAGELDLAARLPQGGWLIADYKVTAHPDPEAYRQQLGLYALALSKDEGAGQPPRTALCFLGPQGGRLAWLEFSARDLRALEARARQAAQDIAALGATRDPFALPASPDCAASHCALEWLCAGKEAA